jgi:hypothetical protein
VYIRAKKTPMKKLCKQAVILSFVFGIIACEESEKSPAKLFTITFDNNVMEGWNNRWIIASNEKGEVLDFSEIKTGTSVQLEPTKAYSQVDVTIFQSRLGSYFLETYRNVDPGQEIKFVSYPPARNVSVAGHVNYRITNFPGTNPSAELTFYTENGGNVTSSTFTAGTCVRVQDIYDNPSSSVVILGKRAGKPVYAKANFQVNTTVEIDFNNFLELENLYSYDFPGRKSVRAFDATGYSYPITSDFVQSGSGTPSYAYIGTVPGYSTYVTQIENLNFGSMSYYKYGAPLTRRLDAADYFQFSHSVSDVQFANISVTSSRDYDYVRINYVDPVLKAGEVLGTWSVYAKEGVEPRVLFDLPFPLTQQNPGVAKNQFSYDGTTFYFSNAGYTYNDMIQARFTQTDKSNYEQVVADIK